MNKKAHNYLLFTLLLSLIVFLSACGSSELASVPAEATSTPTLEEQFLSDLVDGLAERFADDQDVDPMTFWETKAYYKTLVNYELDRLSIYENETFSDGVFDQLAHDYIKACQQQIKATDLTDEDQMYEEWGKGLFDRALILIELRDKYGLALTDEMSEYFEETITYTLEDYALDLTAAMNEDPEEGIDCSVEVNDDGLLLFRFWIDGLSGDAYRAAQGDKEYIDIYTDEIKSIVDEFWDLQNTINDQLQEVGLPETEIEIHIMNDVNRNNTMSIIKKGGVVFDTTAGIDLLSVGEELG